jgi:hypothetical protein
MFIEFGKYGTAKPLLLCAIRVVRIKTPYEAILLVVFKRLADVMVLLVHQKVAIPALALLCKQGIVKRVGMVIDDA